MPRPVIAAARHGSAGYALVLVLMGVAVLSLIAGTVAIVSTDAAGRFGKTMLRAQLQCAVEAGAAEAIISLADLRPAMQWPIDGAAREISFQGIPVTVSVEAEMGKVDINAANETLLTGLFAAIGQDKTTADMYAERILDWRELGNLKRLNGAKAADYRAAGLPYHPRGGPFQTIDELQLVLGMTPSLYRQLAPYITVYSNLASPEWQTAPAIVLQAMGMDKATIDVIMAARERAANAAGETGAGPSHSILGQPGTAFTISAEVGQNGFHSSLTETIRFTGNPQQPYWVLASRP